MRTRTFAKAALALLFAAGCSPDGGDADAGADSDTLVDTDTGNADDECSLMLSETCAEIDGGLVSAVLEKEALVGTGAATLELLALAPRAVLAEMYDGLGPGPTVIFANPWIEDADEWDHVAYIPDGPGGFAAKGIAAASGLFGGDAGTLYDVLLCGDVGCEIWGVPVPPEDPDDEAIDPITGLLLTELAPLAEIAVAGAATLRGLSAVPGGAACVFGDGVFCNEAGEWTVAVAPGTGPLLNDLELIEALAPDGVGPVAVGDAGRVVSLQDGAWVEIETGTSWDLLNVAVQPNGFHAGGEEGAVVSLFADASGEPPPAVLAFAGDEKIVKTGPGCAFGDYADAGDAVAGFTASGCAFVLGPAGVTDCWSVPLHPGPAIDLAPYALGEEILGAYILTRERLFRYGPAE